MKPSVSTICVSSICYIDDLRSGQYRDLPIISQWTNFQVSLLRIGSFPSIQDYVVLDRY